ncbi:MAG TPA: 6-carboxytetrahydropterin synthase QueD [Candidatus Omnitrophota bacterium]|nr:6-carboxytetrahydropterin synthase QueD [Candidatus Omnitrophota bacterium]HPT39531.1 6-carboxytetrahydropterin synthase QueD [Candidatus Omnitrophota bacterium]
MYSLKVQGTFSSAHNLRGYKGKCEDLHGHNWLVEIIVKSAELDDIGMVLDFKLLKKKLNACLEEMDHQYLNKLDYFKKINPTSENIAKYIYKQLKTRIPLLSCVTVWENSSSSANYEE